MLDTMLVMSQVNFIGANQEASTNGSRKRKNAAVGGATQLIHCISISNWGCAGNKRLCRLYCRTSKSNKKFYKECFDRLCTEEMRRCVEHRNGGTKDAINFFR